MIKRRKDGGFTLIELMIVIAVIGILAVVLVPKMSGVKDSARSTGVVANGKSVQAYCIANIDQWVRTASLDAAGVATLIETQFGATGPDALKNHVDASFTAIDAGAASAAPVAAKGRVTATVAADKKTITINGYGNTTSDIVFEAIVQPN